MIRNKKRLKVERYWQLLGVTVVTYKNMNMNQHEQDLKINLETERNFVFKSNYYVEINQ